MKVLHVINHLLYGGAQSLVVDLLAAEKRAGVEVTLLCLVEREANGFTKRIEENGIDILYLQKGGNMRNPLLIFKLIPHIKRYDVIHVHSFPDEYWVPFAKMISLSKCKIIYTQHSTHSNKFGHPILKHIDSFVYKKLIYKVACCSDKALDEFHHFYPDINATSVPNGINIDKYSLAEPSSIKDDMGIKDSFIITMVARFNYPKRQDVLIKALPKLPSEIKLFLIGGNDGDENLAPCRELVKELGLKDRVFFLGIRNDVPELLKASDVVALVSEYEGLSLSCLEGMAAGKPFIASNSGGLREIVKDAGLLFEIDDSESLVEYITSLYENKETYNKVSRACFERAQHYSIEDMTNRYINLYNKAISK